MPAFARQQDGDEVIIGRVDTGIFLAIPPEAVEVLDHLAQGKSIGEAADLYQQKHGEIPDLDEFLSLLESKGIVGRHAATSPSHHQPESVQLPAARVRYHFQHFPQRLAQQVFSLPALVIYSIIFAAGVALLVPDPALISRSSDLYFPDYRVLCWTFVVLLSYAGVFVHEFAHLVAARALDINARMGISNRLWYLVAETDLTGLWTVPKRQRYLALVAGGIVDAVCWALLIFLLFAHDKQWVSLSALSIRLLRAAAFTYVMRILWQCFLFLRTDFYYVIASFFNCRNLLADTEVFLRNQLARLIPSIKKISQADIPEAEQRIVRAYAAVWLAGRAFALALLLLVTVPLGISYTRALGQAIRAGYSANPGQFVDTVVLAAYFFVPFTLGVALWIRGLVRTERTSI